MFLGCSVLPVEPDCCSGAFPQFHMSYADQERYENEERPEVQRQILAEIARKLPVYTRTGNGGLLLGVFSPLVFVFLEWSFSGIGT